MLAVLLLVDPVLAVVSPVSDRLEGTDNKYVLKERRQGNTHTHTHGTRLHTDQLGLSVRPCPGPAGALYIQRCHTHTHI